MAKEDNKARDKAAQPAKAAPMIRAVYGDMVDSFDNTRYTTSPVPAPEVKEGSWVDSQLKAKKMELL